jgi:hypothetical protein
MKKRTSYRTITILVFSLLTTGTGLISLFSTPQTTVSAAEETYGESFDTWFNARFFQQDGWRSLQTRLRRATGSIENNGIYFGTDGSLIPQFQSYDAEVLSQNISTLETFCTVQGITGNILLVPTASWGRSSVLPAGAADVNQTQLLKSIGRELSDQNYVDLTTYTGPSSSYYFKTEPYWNEQGAYQGYLALAAGVLDRVPKSFFYQKAGSPFQGTLCTASGADWAEEDTIYTITAQLDILQIQVTYEDDSQASTLYCPDCLNSEGPYDYYLGGDHRHTHIETNVTPARRAVIVGDSSVRILLPYLVYEYSTIDFVDLSCGETDVSALLTQDTDVYFIYQLDNFSKNLVLENLK